jgi:hypothetical protein
VTTAILTLVALWVWGLFVRRRAGVRLWRTLLPIAGTGTRKAGLLGAGLQLASMAVYITAVALGLWLAGATGDRWPAGVVIGLAGLLHVPIVVGALPDRHDYYADARDLVETAGGTPAQAHAATRAGGPFAFLGAALTAGGLLAAFDA